MDISIFPEKDRKPGEHDLAAALGETYAHWCFLRDHVTGSISGTTGEWNFPGMKYGWNYRIKDKRRAVIYLLPRDKYFLAAMVFGPKATNEILAGDIAHSIREELRNARPYAEGRGIRIEIRDGKLLPDILKLITIKTS